MGSICTKFEANLGVFPNKSAMTQIPGQDYAYKDTLGHPNYQILVKEKFTDNQIESGAKILPPPSSVFL